MDVDQTWHRNGQGVINNNKKYLNFGFDRIPDVNPGSLFHFR